ncbi:putative trans-sialidase, Group V [Trypanosoma cruzi]|uniref:Trans-sialidase, putative n=2 Tax=Trypanosoma cruzi TaxID=5693 RepID=Q4D349_TRYCC|nr:trans-sialidase, putative [Trypanosoma cruzi]EAN86949.1 trans-sialidase, putative [Trypanosoma cruzi]PWV06205.1 putative trans-sialidase, Group V [Trypanosoma cruzi]|eukprot:XP_808800.1 trans-sialidase [Trypanosoma cruzi strain CL Brener]
MHSRVAAVKAPRTHNRRRVTGSNGRREGRESETQRSNMSRRVFTSAVLLLFFVMICCGSGGATATDNGASAPGTSPKTHFVWRDKKGGETVSSLRVPVLVEMDGDVFAVAEAQCTEASNSGFTGIASELLEWTDQESRELDTTKLKTQVLEECQFEQGKCPSPTGAQDAAASQNRKKVGVSRPTTVVNGSDIHMFARTYSFEVTEGVGSTAAAAKWRLLGAVGKVSNDGSSGKKYIYWEDASVIPWTEFEKQQEFLTRLIGGGGSGIKMKDGTLVLPVEGTKKDGKAVSLIIYSANESGKLSKGMSADGCSDPSVVEWKDKLMMMTACDDGRRRVYESGDKGGSWTEALGTLSRVWFNKHEGNEKGVGSGFSTATIENRDVMLVTVPVYSNRKGNEGAELHLWLTDNTHIADIGPVSGNDDAAASSLLYKSAGSGNNNNERLIALYEKGGGESSLGMVSVRLTAQLKHVREVLATWKKVDGRVSKLCPSTAATNPSTGNGCSTVKITAGLVGFLSGKFSGNTWRDEYLGVDATVKKGTNGVATGYADGVTFQGVWAEWPVGKQGENQLYYFANHNFTLVATVSIHGVPKGDTPIPLMGATMNDNKNPVLLGLSYDKEGKWQVLCGGKTTKELRSNWEPGTTHQVAIVLRNGKQGSAYVDGQRVGDASCELKNTDSKGISHFYIGGDGGSAGSKEDVPVTATNVLLYNRPLDDNEIRVLNANKISIPKLKGLKKLAAGATGEGTARDGGAHGDGSTVCGGGLLPLLLLLGLWGIAAS